MSIEFIESFDLKIIDSLFVDEEITAKALRDLSIENEKILLGLKTWMGNEHDGFAKTLNPEIPKRYVDSLEEQIIALNSVDGMMSYEQMAKVKKLSHLVNESKDDLESSRCKYVVAMPIEIEINSEYVDVEIDKVCIDNVMINRLVHDHGLVSDGVKVVASKYVFWADAYPVHKRSDYMLYILDRLKMNADDSKHEIDPVMNRSYRYEGRLPRYPRTYYLILEIYGEKGINPLNAQSDASRRILYNSLRTMIQNSDERFKSVVCYPIELISKSLLVVEKLSVKADILEYFMPLMVNGWGGVNDIDVYVRTSSLKSGVPYDSDCSCSVDIVIPGYEFENKHGEQDEAIISYDCVDAIHVIELLEGINLVYQQVEDMMSGEFVYYTVQYEKNGGLMAYTTDESFKDSYGPFKGTIDFYYFEEEAVGFELIEDEVELGVVRSNNNDVIAFPGVDDD